MTATNKIVMEGITLLENKKETQCSCFRAKVLTDHKVAGGNETIQEFLDKRVLFY